MQFCVQTCGDSFPGCEESCTSQGFDYFANSQCGNGAPVGAIQVPCPGKGAVVQYPDTTRQGFCTNGDGCDVVGVAYNKATVTVNNNGLKCCGCQKVTNGVLPSALPTASPSSVATRSSSRSASATATVSSTATSRITTGTLAVRGAGVGSIMLLANTPPGMLACFGSNAAGTLGIGDAATAFTSQQNAPGIVVQAPESAPADAPLTIISNGREFDRRR